MNCGAENKMLMWGCKIGRGKSIERMIRGTSRKWKRDEGERNERWRDGGWVE